MADVCESFVTDKGLAFDDRLSDCLPTLSCRQNPVDHPGYARLAQSPISCWETIPVIPHHLSFANMLHVPPLLSLSSLPDAASTKQDSFASCRQGRVIRVFTLKPSKSLLVSSVNAASEPDAAGALESGIGLFIK